MFAEDWSPRQAARPSFRHYVAQGIRHRADCPAAITAAGAILYYLEFTEHRQTGPYLVDLAHRRRPVRVDRQVLDPQPGACSRPTADRKAARCSTCWTGPDRRWAARMLRRWISLPLKDPGQINRRLDVVSLLRDNASLREMLAEAVASTGDLERIISRVGGRTGNPAGGRTAEKRAVRRRKDQDTPWSESGQEPPEGNWPRKLDLCLEVRDRIEQGNLSRPVEPDSERRGDRVRE